MEEGTKREAPYKEDARDGDGDGLVQDGTVHERPLEATPPKRARTVPSSIPQGAEVSLRALEGAGRARNSASAALVRARLLELGHLEAGEDAPGSMGPSVLSALAGYRDAAAPGEEPVSKAVLAALFAGTGVKTLP